MSFHLCNWRSSTLPGGAAYDPARLELYDLDVAVEWLPAPYDQEWRHFSLIFVLTEARAAAALRAAVAAADEGDASASVEAAERSRRSCSRASGRRASRRPIGAGGRLLSLPWERWPRRLRALV